MNIKKVSMAALLFSVMAVGTASATTLDGLVPMEDDAVVVEEATTTAPAPVEQPTGEKQTTNTEVSEPLANNGNDLPLEQGVTLESGNDVVVPNDEPAPAEPVAAPAVVEPAAPAPTAAVVPVSAPKLEKLPKTGNDPYTSSPLFMGSMATIIVCGAYLFFTRKATS